MLMVNVLMAKEIAMIINPGIFACFPNKVARAPDVNPIKCPPKVLRFSCYIFWKCEYYEC
jgi:hypothetical protein